MIVPNYWAEARIQHREPGKQVTVRRFGWSDAGQEEAQSNAQERANEAMRRLLAGEDLPRREPKVPYNGADGVPIREEVIDRHGDTVITRNSYGALCLNTPDVLFADVDFERSYPTGLGCTLALVGMAFSISFGLIQGEYFLGIILGIGFALFGLLLAEVIAKLSIAITGGLEKRARRRIGKWIELHPDWRLRVYRTPNGLRLLATHRQFLSDEAEVADFFDSVGTDPLYARMCRNQRCFRARVSPKPWRIGLGKHIKPRPGTWPVRPEAMPQRREWIASYEEKSKAFASARFEEELGTGSTNGDALEVQRIHDELSRATSGLPIA